MGAPGRKSKKPSAARSHSKQPEPPVFFLDRSLGKKLVATALRKAGATVQVHDDHFPPDARDEVWLQEVGRRGWIVLTKDQRIRYRRSEIAALQTFGVQAFVLTAGDLQGTEMGETFVRALPAMHRTLARHAAPFIAAVSRMGRISVLT